MVRSTPKLRKPIRPYHHGNLRRALLDEALDDDSPRMASKR